MKNKKSVMAFSAILILLFHLWIPMFPGNVAEDFVRQIAYVGVDIFFFLSAYALSGRKVENYLSFVANRFAAVYVKFIIFAVIACLYTGWAWTKLVKVLVMGDLLEKGGGAFLWFLPAIMLFYLLFPLLQRCEQKHRYLTLAAVIVIWAAGAAIGTCFDYTPMFIYWNRLPIFLLGFYLGMSKGFKKLLENNTYKLLCGLVCVGVGGTLQYFFGYQPRLQVPFIDMFYIVAIPLSLGLVLLVSFIPEKAVVKWIGSSTLEMYAIQMIFGYNFANYVLRSTRNMKLTNLASILFVIISAILVHYVYQWAQKGVSRLVKKKS